MPARPLLALAVVLGACAPTPRPAAATTPLPHVAAPSTSPVATSGPPSRPLFDPGMPQCPDFGGEIRQQPPPDVAAVPPYALVAPSGLASCVLRPGSAAVHPDPNDLVAVRYVGWTTAGTVVDSSLGRSEPMTFPLAALIPGWVEGVGLMVEGEVRRLWIPEALAYGGRPGRPAGMLVFDIELVRVDARP